MTRLMRIYFGAAGDGGPWSPRIFVVRQTCTVLKNPPIGCSVDIGYDKGRYHTRQSVVGFARYIWVSNRLTPRL